MRMIWTTTTPRTHKMRKTLLLVLLVLLVLSSTTPAAFAEEVVDGRWCIARGPEASCVDMCNRIKCYYYDAHGNPYLDPDCTADNVQLCIQGCPETWDCFMVY